MRMKPVVVFPIATLVVVILFATGCASMGGSSGSCIAGKIDDNGVPCWVNQKPKRGIVVSMSEHVDPNKTRETLFKKAQIEIAAGQTGVNISEDSIVKKRTTVTGSDNVSQQVKVVNLASVKSAGGSALVKAKIEDEWKHPSSRKLYLWVVPQ